MKKIIAPVAFTFKLNSHETFEFDPEIAVLVSDDAARIISERFGGKVNITDMEPDTIVDAPEVEVVAPVVNPPEDAPLPSPEPAPLDSESPEVEVVLG